MEDKEENNGKAPSFLKSVVSAFGIVTAWVFVIGWVYLHTYYAYFGLNVDSLDFPPYHYFIFCYTQFVPLGRSGVAMTCLLLAFFLTTWLGIRAKKMLGAVLISFIYVALFLVGFYFAVSNGRAAAIHHMGLGSPLPKIMVELKKENGEDIQYAATEEALGSSDLRLLLETKDQLFVFVPVDTAAERVRVSVLAIDRHEAPLSMRVITAK